MRLWTSGSAPLLPQDFERIYKTFGREPVEREGMTETGMNFSNPLRGKRKPGSIGAKLLHSGSQIGARGLVQSLAEHFVRVRRLELMVLRPVLPHPGQRVETGTAEQLRTVTLGPQEYSVRIGVENRLGGLQRHLRMRQPLDTDLVRARRTADSWREGCLKSGGGVHAEGALI